MHVHGHTWFTAPIEIPLSQSGSSDGSKCWFCFFFCMHWLGRVDSAYTFSSVVCMRMLGRSRIILPDNPEFIPVAQTNTCSSSSSVIVEKKKAYNTKSRQFLDNFPLITTFLCTSANISMIHLIRGYTYIISFRLLFIISDEIIFMSRIFHIALKHKTFGTTTATTI